jgi:hypothetical protein
LVRCPVCEGTAVSVVLNSKPRASCGSCGASWIQEGSWQRAIRAGQAKLPVLSMNAASGLEPTVTLEQVEQDVIVLPDRVHPPARAAIPKLPPEEAIAT